MTSATLLYGSIAAFVSAVFIVLTVRSAANGVFENYAHEWAAAQRHHAGKIPALLELSKLVLVREGRRLDTIERVYVQLKTDVVRANAPTTAEEYLGQSLLEGIACLVVGLIVLGAAFGPFSAFIPVVLAISWAIWIRPSLIQGDAAKRTRSIYRGIPYALDLGVLVLQAGGTLREVLDQAATASGALAEELRLVIKEIDSGAAQATALRNMCDRVGLEALETIVLAINRGEETGAPMAQTLSTQAQLFRERRLQELEKLAVEAPTKMTFPNMMVMLSVLVIVLGPLLVRITTSGML